MRRRTAAALVIALTVPGAALAATDGQLLARHRPVLVLHPAERFVPIFVEQFVTSSDLELRTATGWQRADAASVQNLPRDRSARLNVRSCNAGIGLAATECYANAAPPAAGGVIYGSARRLRGRLVLQYWLFYAYNPWSAEPAAPTPRIWRSHEGDWEQVTIVLDRRGRPLDAGYSQHCGGERRPWPRVPRWKRTPRPLVYVALGSHANYFARGAHRHERRCWPEAALEVFRVNGLFPTDYTAVGRVLTPDLTKLVRVTPTTPAWMTFPGAWGEDGFFHAPGLETVRFGLGPEGPGFHASWRDPLLELRRYRPRVKG